MFHLSTNMYSTGKKMKESIFCPTKKKRGEGGELVGEGVRKEVYSTILRVWGNWGKRSQKPSWFLWRLTH